MSSKNPLALVLRPVVQASASPSPNWHFAGPAPAPASAPESVDLSAPASPVLESFDLTLAHALPGKGTAEADAAGLGPLLALASDPAAEHVAAHLAAALEAFVAATAPAPVLEGLTPAQRLLFLFASPALAGAWGALGAVAGVLSPRLAVRDERRIHAWGQSQATCALVGRYRDEVGSFVTAYDTVDALATELASDNEQYALAVLTTYVDARLAAGYTRDTAARQLSFVQQSVGAGVGLLMTQVRRYIAVFAAARERYAFAVLTW
ncbi:hypothetical protein Q8F55_001726 [Vanrija albida]|uniref:Uncharacterized protein n=1 Tax=Vanrija albida TaxID=181172 RepID=A0ABR3Q7R3_9TREE